MRRGIIGYFATFHSTNPKMRNEMNPKMSKQMIVADFQGYSTPPSSRPKRIIRVPPMTKNAPAQSIAFKPAMRGVFGVFRSRKKKMIIKASPSRGRFK